MFLLLAGQGLRGFFPFEAFFRLLGVLDFAFLPTAPRVFVPVTVVEAEVLGASEGKEDFFPSFCGLGRRLSAAVRDFSHKEAFNYEARS